MSSGVVLSEGDHEPVCVAVTTTWIWVEAHGVPFPCSQLGMQGSPGRICNILPFKNQISSRIQEEDEKRRRNKELLSSAFPCCPGCCLLVLGVLWTPEISAVMRWSHSIIASTFPIWKFFSPEILCVFSGSFSGLLSHTWFLSLSLLQLEFLVEMWCNEINALSSGRAGAEGLRLVHSRLWRSFVDYYLDWGAQVPQGWVGVRSCDLDQGWAAANTENLTAAESREAHGSIWLF